MHFPVHAGTADRRSVCVCCGSVSQLIAEGRQLYDQASSIIMQNRGVGKAAKGNAQLDGLQSSLALVADAFDELVRRCESASRVAGVSKPKAKGRGDGKAVAGTGTGVDSDDEVSEDVRREERTRQQLRMEIHGVKGFGEVEMSILQVCVRVRSWVLIRCCSS